MSRHHVMLPPIVYTPVPKPKLARRRRAVGTLNKGASSAVSDLDEADETDETNGLGRPTSTAGPSAANASTPFDASEQCAGTPRGRLSATTLRTLLQAQEETK